ncbi:CcdB family protein [Siccirubricoccus phaeus]|uniref:CcdB family protein n=1 Tax=Siccirubricoccus phaeus TaxID=2595053 RepID=UPI0011F163A5|nr:CcdB family protein [Siccirubricoccus phaeus]
MPRFDLYPGRQGVPYLLDVQSDHLERLPTRMVVPLGVPDTTLPPFRDLTPTLLVDGAPHVMLTPLMAAVPRRLLGRPIGNLLDQADDITRALGILLTGF